MKLRSLFFVVIAAVLAVALPRSARALDVSFSFFQESLSPYGEWLEVGDYGYCWRPTGVDEDWAPYSDGYWTYTDGGWTWVSYEDFGGIVYHYGRWVKVEDEGWVWVPDYEWAPAWVSWRSSDDYLGWAPLPPEARWQRDRGFSTWVDYSYDIAPSSYNFVRVVDFGAPVLRPWVFHRRDNVFYVQKTVNITNISFNNGAGCVFNGGPDFVRINRFANRPIPALKLVRNTNVTVVNNTIINNNVRVRNVNAVQQGNQLVVVAPNVTRPEAAQVTALVKPNVRRTIPQARVTKGWNSLAAEERNAVRAKLKQETKDLTPETAPARPVKVADLQMVPQKADPDAPSPTAIRKDRPRPNVPSRGKVAADGDPTTTPTTEQPAAVEKPANPRDAQRIAREKAKQKDAPESKPAEVTTAPVPESPTAIEKPADPREAAKIAREKARREKATPEPKAADTTAVPVVRERPLPVRPGVTKPFNPAAENEPPAVTKTPATDDTAAKRAAAQQAAQERAAAAREKAAEQQQQQQQAIRQRQAAQEQAQEAAKARAAEQQQQQQIIRQRQVDEQAQDAARKRASETVRERQQQQQDQSAGRERAVQQQEAIRQRQAAQQSQEAARERAEQAAAQRQRAAESQQQQQQAVRERAAQPAEVRQRAAEQQQVQAARAAAAERSQVQAARQQAIQQQQAQSAAREQAVARAQAQNAARQQAQPQQRQAPAQRGKRQLTPEEAEALKNQR